MSESIAFLSFDVRRNLPERDEFVHQLNESGLALSIEDSSPTSEAWVSSKETLMSDSTKLLRGKIDRCHMMIVLVGRGAADAQGIAHEIILAKGRNVPYFGIYVGGADESTELPSGLARNRMIPWDWTRIEAAITQLLAEGKNHTFV